MPTAQDLPAEITTRAVVAKLLVTVSLFAFDACTKLLFTVAVLGSVQSSKVAMNQYQVVAMLQYLAAGGAFLGIASVGSLLFVPATLTAYSKLAASRVNKGKPAEEAAILERCEQDSTWTAILRNASDLHMHVHVPCIDLVRMSTSSINPLSCANLFKVVNLIYFSYIVLLWPTSTTFSKVVMVLYGIVFWASPLFVHILTLYYIRRISNLWPQPARNAQLTPLIRQLTILTNVGGLFLGDGVCSLPGVWAWLWYTELKPKLSVRADNMADSVACSVLKDSVKPAVTRLLVNGWCLLVAYTLTEWIRMLLMSGIATVAAASRMSPDSFSNDSLRIVVAALSATIELTKSARDKWKLLERGMQQMSYAGALVFLFEEHFRTNEWKIDGVDINTKGLHRIDILEGWHNLQQPLDAMATNGGDEFTQLVLKAQEMVRRANKAVASDNLKAAFV